MIGVDGGGTKTISALFDHNGNILSRGEGGSCNIRNVGMEKAIYNIIISIKKALNGKNIEDISKLVIGIPCVEEEFKDKKDNIKEEIYSAINFKGEIIIESDQLIAFRAGTDKEDGALLNSGTGVVAHSWNKGKEAKIDGWGYLSEMGSSFWVGQEGIKALFKSIDKRDKETLIVKEVYNFLNVRNKEELIERIYSSNSQELISSLSIPVSRAGEKGDKIAKKILQEGAKELFLTLSIAIKEVNLKKDFPIVLNGSLFKSKIILSFIEKEIKLAFPYSDVIFNVEPVFGTFKEGGRC